MSDAIEISHVTKRFTGHLALNDVDWSAEAGHIHGLIGANGAGKTTLMQLALGVLHPDQGTIAVLGERSGPNNANLRQRVHYVGSNQTLPRGFRVGEWLHYVSLLYPRWDARMASRLLDAMEIGLNASIRSLSTGSQASFRIAVAAAARPELLLLDEATNGMDVVVKRQVMRLLLDMAATEGTTMVFATHAIEEIERVAETVSILYRGRIVLSENLDALKGHVRRFQIVAGPNWSPSVLQHPHVIDVRWQGHVGVVTIDGPPGSWAERLCHGGATLVEPIDMDLADVFWMVLKREGYTRDELAWDA
jgi:ABC-2 type transport system ATP-binding protein